MKDSDFRKKFIAYRFDVPDNGFSKDVKKQLPERKSMLPQIVMVSFIMTGLALMFAIHGFAPVFEQIKSLVSSISQLQIPSPISVITYFCVLTLTGIISFSIANVD